MAQVTIFEKHFPGKHFQEDWLKQIEENELPLPQDEIIANQDWFNLILSPLGYRWNCWLCSIMRDFTFFRKNDYTPLSESTGTMKPIKSENKKLIKGHRKSALHQRSVEEWKKLTLKVRDPQIRKAMKERDFNPNVAATKLVKNIAYTGARLNLSLRKHRKLVKLVER